MVGRRIKVSFSEPIFWHFAFDKGGVITAECPWRLLNDGSIKLSSADHRQQFGLPAPIDAATRATELLSASVVSRAEMRAGTLDILLEFDHGFRLEILPISSGYEGWKMLDPLGRELIAQGGGNLVES